MRPGQLTPENATMLQGRPWKPNCFNEAGAINPGKRVGQPRRAASPAGLQ